MFIKNTFKILIKLTLFCVIIVVFFSCKKDKAITSDGSTLPGTKTIYGKAQKGPYKNGSPLVIYELNNSLGQTGKSFSSTINDDAGNFSLNNISLNSNYILITATGYYYSEHFNKISEGQLYLEALADVSNISSVNINILTHIIKPRIEQLTAAGLDFNTARYQAQNELKTIMGASSNMFSNFETLDLSNNSFLFAMSLLFQRNNSMGYQAGYNYTSELSTLLSNFRNDFANNGAIDNPNIIDTLIYNVNRIDLIDCKIDMQNYYAGLGLTFSTNGFEQFIYGFQKKYTVNLSSSITFPDSAFVMIDAPGAQPPYSSRENILKVNNKFYLNGIGGNQFAVSAIVPYDSTLVVKFTSFNSSSPFTINGGSSFGWKTTQSNPLTLEAQRKNVSLSLLIFATGGDSVKVEYFNNISTAIPYYTKNIIF